MNEKQRVAWERLNKTFDTGIILPKRYGTVEPSLKDAVPYDTPFFLKDWSQDKRKTSIPNYEKKQEEPILEGTPS